MESILEEGFELGVRKYRRDQVHFATDEYPELALGFAYNRTRDEFTEKGQAGFMTDDSKLPIIIVEVPIEVAEVARNKCTFTVEAEHIGLIVVRDVVHLPFQTPIDQIHKALL